MRLRAILPVRSLRDGKRRLAGLLDDEARARLNAAFLTHTIELATRFPGAGATILVSPDPEVLGRVSGTGIRCLEDPGAGLNPAVGAARDLARKEGADGIIVLPIDLPTSRPEDVLRLIGAGTPVAIAPDRRGIGTNALYVDATLDFRFAFGAHSFDAHLTEARRLGVAARIVDNPRLALDIDSPADWNDWTATPDHARWLEALAPA